MRWVNNIVVEKILTAGKHIISGVGGLGFLQVKGQSATPTNADTGTVKLYPTNASPPVWKKVNSAGVVSNLGPTSLAQNIGMPLSRIWTAHASASDSFGWHSVCWAPSLNLFVAVASTGTGNRVMTSPDGIAWTAYTSAVDTNSWQSVCWTGTKFIAVANAGGTNNRVMTSSNGTYWSTIAAGGSYTWKSVCYGNGVSVAVADSGGTGSVLTSDATGASWASITAPNYSYPWSSVCWSPTAGAGNTGLFCAVSYGGTYCVMTSPTGAVWTAATSPALPVALQGQSWSSVCWSTVLNKFIAVGVSGSQQVMTSPDGLNWTGHTLPGSTYTWVSVCEALDIGAVIAVASSGPANYLIAYTVDGVNWYPTLSPGSQGWTGQAWSSSLSRMSVVAKNGTLETMVTL